MPTSAIPVSYANRQATLPVDARQELRDPCLVDCRESVLVTPQPLVRNGVAAAVRVGSGWATWPESVRPAGLPVHASGQWADAGADERRSTSRHSSRAKRVLERPGTAGGSDATKQALRTGRDTARREARRQLQRRLLHGERNARKNWYICASGSQQSLPGSRPPKAAPQTPQQQAYTRPVQHQAPNGAIPPGSKPITGPPIPISDIEQRQVLSGAVRAAERDATKTALQVLFEAGYVIVLSSPQIPASFIRGLPDGNIVMPIAQASSLGVGRNGIIPPNSRYAMGPPLDPAASLVRGRRPPRRVGLVCLLATIWLVPRWGGME